MLVTASNVDGTAEQASAASIAPISPFPPANLVAPVITGTPQRSRTLSATRGTWTGPDNMYGYQWQRDFGEGYVDIAGATGSAYTLTVADVDATVRVLVIATNPDATIVETSEPTAPVLAAGPLNQALAGRQRHRAARAHADRHVRLLERNRQRHQLPVAVLVGRKHLGEDHRRDQPHLRARRFRRGHATCGCS